MSANLLPFKVAEITQTAKESRELVDLVIETAKDPIGISVIVFVFLSIIFYKTVPTAFNYLMKRKQWKTDLMDSYLAKNIAGNTPLNSVISDMRDTYYFNIATGIQAEKNRRESLIALHTSLGDIGSWQMIRRAGSFLRQNDQTGMYVPEFTTADKLGSAFNTMVFIFFASIFAVGFSILVFLPPKDLNLVKTLALCVVASFILIAYSAFQNFPYLAAKKIQKKLRETTSR